jgi:hypothetical protein
MRPLSIHGEIFLCFSFLSYKVSAVNQRQKIILKHTVLVLIFSMSDCWGHSNLIRCLRRNIRDDISSQCGAVYLSQRFEMTDLPEFTTPSEGENVSSSQLSLVTLHSFILALRLA